MKVFKYIISITILIAFGFFFQKAFLNFSFSFLDTDRVILESLTASGLSLIFPIVLGILPLFYLLIYKATKVSFLYKGLMACGIMITLGILFWRLRVYGLNIEFDKLSEYKLSDDLQPRVEISYLKLEVYLLMGFIVGALMSILIFRDKNKPLLN